MSSAAALRRQIEAALEQRIPAALSPRPRTVREQAGTGVPEVDALLEGGLPIGAITELVGPPCSGRSTLALSVLAELTSAGKVVAWVDAADTLDPASAAAAGVDLSRQLWVRCGGNPTQASSANKSSAPAAHTPTVQTGPPLLVEGSRIPASSGGCGSPHPRGEARGLSQAIDTLLQPDTFARSITPRGVEASPRPNARKNNKNKMIGTPSAPNLKLDGSRPTHAPFPHRAADRQEQIPSDRQPSRRQNANFKASQRTRGNLSTAQIAYTGQVAGAWNDNRNNAHGRAFQTAPNAIASGLPRFQNMLGMEARASGQGHGTHRGPIEWKPSLAALRDRRNVSPLTFPKPRNAPQPRVSQAPFQKPGLLSAANTSRATALPSLAGDPPPNSGKSAHPTWKALDQALRATDLLLAAGGFSAIVLDLGSIPPEFAWRIPLATWFRFRAGAERSRTVFLLLTQHPCARSSAELVLRLSPVTPHATRTVLTGAGFALSIDRQRFETTPAVHIPPLPTNPPADKLHLVPTRKPPQRERAVSWQRPVAWARGGA